MASTIEIFFCYAREDEELREGLEKQLRALKRQGIIDVWHDREISAGAEWEREIDKHLNSAQIILLLVSPDFMDSDYCFSIEMQRAMERHKRGEAQVIPVILRPIYWREAPFGKLQALPTDAKPVMSRYWHNLDEAFFDVAEGIRKAIKKLMPSLEASAEIKQSKEIEPSQAALQTSQPATLPDKVQKTKKQWRKEGDRLSDLNRYEEALAAYEQALRLDPNDAVAYINKGVALNELKRYEEALAACEQALRLDPNSAAAYGNKGGALNGLKRYEEALVAYEQALRLDPNYAYAYNNKGGALYRLKRYQEALEACEQSLRLDPNNANAYNNKGIALRNLKRYEEALAAYEQALRLDPNYAYAYNNEGATLNGLKRYEEALTACEQALLLDPNLAEAYDTKGHALNGLNRKEEAQQAYEKARQLGYSE